jgi:hypothetical protein
MEHVPLAKLCPADVCRADAWLLHLHTLVTPHLRCRSSWPSLGLSGPGGAILPTPVQAGSNQCPFVLGRQNHEVRKD